MLTPRVSRRSVIWSIGGGVVAALVAACGGAPASPTAAPVAPTSVPKPTQAPASAAAPAAPTAASAAPTTAPAAPTTAPAVAPTVGATATAASSSAAAPTPAAATFNLTTENIELWFQGHVAGGQAEQKAYDDTLQSWQKLHPNIKVRYQVVPDVERIQKVTAEVAANQAPDLWRHNYGVIRLWASQGQLLDLTDRLKGYDKLFLPAFMAASLYKGHIWGLPHTTDTSALFYRQDALDAIGVKAPTDVKDAWTYEQFGQICDQLMKAGKQQFAFTENQGGGRWVPSYLYSSGGRLVTPDFSKIAINSPEGIRALQFVKQWFDKKWTPTDVWMVWITSRPNGDTDPFVRGETSMGMLGLWNITYLDENIKDRFKWGVTYEPRDKVQSTSMGGTPIVGWAKTKHPEETAAFMSYFVSPEMMKMFDEMANYLPTRLDLSSQNLTYATRPDLVSTFQKQDAFLPLDYVSFVARSYSSGIGTIVNEETTKMTTQGQTPEQTAKNIETRGNKYIQENPDPEMK